MPRYSIQGPDGKTYSIDGPEGATREEVIAAIQQQQAIQKEQQRIHETKTGFMPALKAGARGFLGGAEEALGFDQAAKEQFQKAAQTYEGTTEADIERAKQEGVLSTLGAYKSKYLTEPLGGIVGRFGAPMAAAAALPESLIGTGAAAALARAGTMALTDLPAEVGENVERQRERGQEIDRGAATLAGLAQAAIASVGIPGTGAITKLLGPRLLAEAEALVPRVRAGVLTQEQAVQQLSSRGIEFARATAANAVTGTGLMAGTEELRRLQAGQELMTPQELGETAIQGAAIAPIFGALHGFGARGKAEAALTEAQKAREEDVKKILDTKYKLASLDEKVRLQKLFEDEQFKEQLRTKIHSESDKPVQQIIDETLGIGEKIGKTAADVKAALNEPSGQWVVDPETQVERQLTVGELQKIQRPDLFTGEEAKVVEDNIVTDKTLTDLGIGKSTPLVKQGGLRGLDLNKPEEAQQFIEGITAFGSQAKLDQKIKDAIDAKVKEIQDKQKEAEDARLRTERDTEGVQLPGGPGETSATGELTAADRLRADELATDTGPAKVGEEGRGAPLATEVMKGENEITQKIKDMVGKSLKESKMEEKGQSILNELEDSNTSPKDVAKKFWGETYFNLPAEVQRKFTRYLKSLSGFEPGKYWRDWLHIADEHTIDLPKDISHLEGTERGYISLMEEANRRYAEAKSKIAPEAKLIQGPKYALGEAALIRETPETIIAALKDKFGKNINKAIERGDVKVIKSSEIPKGVDPNAIAFFHEGVAHLVSDRLSKEDAPRKILHEVGVHFGLEGMLGKNLYRDILRTVNRLKETDKDVKAAHEHVNRHYKELAPGTNEHLEEVLARIGESAPNHSLWRRAIAAIKEFLYKKGLWNVNKMDVHDIHDLINRSTARSLAGKVKPTELGTKAAKNEEVLKKVAGWVPKRIQDIWNTYRYMQNGREKDTKAYATMISPDQFLGLTMSESHFESLLKDNEIRNKITPLNLEQLKKYDMPMFLDVVENKDGTWQVVDHEGRHRMVALSRAGIQEVPVVIRTKDVKSRDSISGARLLPQKFDKESGVNGATLNKLIPINYENKSNIINMVESPAIRYAKGEEKIAPISDRYKDTAVFASPAEEADKSFKEHVGGMLDRAKNIDRGTMDRAFTGARIKVANPAAGVQTELIRKYNGAVVDAMGNMRADIAHDQALNSNILGATAAKEGRVVLSKTEGAKVIKDPNNLYAIFDELEKLSKRIGAVDAEHVGGAYLQALRYKEILNANDRYDTQIKNLEDQLRKDKKEAQAKGTQKDILDYKKLEDTVSRTIARLKDKKKEVTKEQQDAIPAALAYAEEHPEIKRIAEIYDKQRLNEIDMLEEAGIYGKEFAQELRETKGYVPLFRLMDDLENITPGARQHFRGLADIGKEHAFEGSERRAMNIFDNMLTRHMWAVNAATRNFASRMIADELAMRKEDGTLKTYNILPENKADVMTPIWIDGKRTFVEYADPFFARAVYGMEPALPGILGWFGKASKILRTGVTALPTFQAYQVFNDATRAAMISGVNHPFKLIGEIVGSFGTILKDPNDPIVKEMNRLGISGGYGHTAKEVADKMRRERGMLATSLTQKAFDKAEKFAATSDMAQRRALFRRTLLETGGVEQADGSIIGGNKVLAMDRAMNIIHWQKRGASNSVRVMTQIVPFMNAYIQGMDILLRSMRGEGISGRERKEAQWLFVSTALKLSALSAIYSMAVSSDEEYQKLDDRTKVRSLIIPGTGIKIPVANEVAMLTKAIPELGWQYINRADTNNPMDATKLMNEIGRSFVDGLASPNLMPQGVRGIVEVATNHNFLTGNPIVGRGLEHLETSEQFTENTSELAKFIGASGIISPLNLDHLLKGYGGTMASGALYMTDAFANLFYDNKLPTTSLHKVPVINAFLYSPNGKDQLNDYYDLKDRSDEVTATLNKYLKFGTKEQIKEYSEENRAMINARGQINQIGNVMKILREQRKMIINSNLDSDEKRRKIDEIDVRINKQVENIGAIRVKAGL